MVVVLLCSGTHKAYQFSASDVVATVHQETTTTQSIFLDRTQTLTVGEVRYLHNEDDLDYDITDEFYAAVMSLPVRLYFGLSAEEKQLYQSFIEEWGTVNFMNTVLFLLLVPFLIAISNLIPYPQSYP